MPVPTISLRDWHTRLEKHFGELCVSRQASSGHPLYALEHGLSQPEREELFESVRAAIQVGRPSKVFWLPWVVYAAEVGYEFAGEEYWQTYEERTPGWDRNEDRHWLRESFRRFSQRFGGAEPQGEWARHFSVICWPITHAVLPRDLQQQLAQALHDLRWTLRIEHLTDPLVLGAAIQTRSAFQNSRFAAFAKDPALVGQIAAALLLNDSSQTGHLIHPAALERIAADLDRQRVAREWLAEARQQAAQVRLRGVLPSGGQRAAVQQPAADEFRTAARSYQRSTLGIDPRLVLRPSDDGAWTVNLEIPDLQHLLESAEWADVLSKSRCRVAGAGKRPLAPGRLLYGSQLVALERWPRADEVLLAFEQATPAVNAALKTTTLLSHGPWLFKLAADGRAYHIRSRVFRPDSNYLLVTTDSIEYDRILARADIRCAGVSAARISVPACVPANLEGVLREYGISRASSVRIAPAGMPPLFWDGEGHAEWLTTDIPVLSVERESDAEAVELVLEGSPGGPVRIPGGPENPALVELPSLPAGMHSICVTTRSANHRSTTARLEITVRAPRPWNGVLGEQHAVQVTIAPAQPTMEDLLSGRFRLDVRGPAGMRLDSDVTLWDYRRQTRLYGKSLPSARLPFDTAGWHRTFVREFLDAQPVQQALDRGWAVDVDLSFGAVAAQRLQFIRHLAPLRLSVRSGRRGFDLFLADDTGAEGTPVVHFRSFRDPAIPMLLAVPGPGEALEIPDGGGLVEAVHGNERTLAVMAPAGVKELGALRVEPRLPPFRRAPDGMGMLTALAALWADATPQGSRLARLRQCDMLRAIHACLVGSLCGSRWLAAERKFLAGEVTAHDLAREVTDHQGEAEFRKELKFAPRRFAGMPREDRVESLVEILTCLSDQRSRDPGIVAAALQAMSTPERLPGLDESCWRRLLEDATLMRAARFVVIATHESSGVDEIMSMPLYAGWN